MNKAARRGVRLVILESSEGQFALVQVRDGRREISMVDISLGWPMGVGKIRQKFLGGHQGKGIAIYICLFVKFNFTCF